MNNIRRTFHKLALVTAASFSLGMLGGNVHAASAEDLNKDAAQALQTLYKTNPVAENLSKTARGILVFPKIIKAGLVFGGSYGEGVLTKGSQFAGYYNSVSASWGWQAGAESYGYVVFLMSDKAVKYLDKSKGWEFGALRLWSIRKASASAPSSTQAREPSTAYSWPLRRRVRIAQLTQARLDQPS